MLVYITGTEYKNAIDNAIYDLQLDTDLLIGEPLISNNVNLLQVVKVSLCKNKEIDNLVIDLSVCNDSEDNIKKAIKQIRYFNSQCNVIIIATQYSIGDQILSDFVDMGVYGIITEEDLLEATLKEYVLNPVAYKEASIYKIEDDSKKKKLDLKSKAKKTLIKSKRNKTKVLIKPLKGKINIALAGTQNRVGVTHTSILLAYNLVKKGYRVALVELNNHNDFKELTKCYDYKCYENEISPIYRIENIDFYNNVTTEVFWKIQALDYDYIISDCGNYSELNFAEFNRADIKIFRFGSAPWEQKYLSELMKSGIDVLKNYKYCTIADSETQKDIKDEFDSLKLDVNFLKFNPDPFILDETILKLVNGYISEEKQGFLNKVLLW